MTVTQLHKYYGSYYAAAQALGVCRQVVSGWVKRGGIPPLAQYRYERLTNGELTVRDDYLRIQINKLKNKDVENEQTSEAS